MRKRWVIQCDYMDNLLDTCIEVYNYLQDIGHTDMAAELIRAMYPDDPDWNPDVAL